MYSVFNDLLPYILTAIIPAIGLYIGYIHQLRTKVAIVEKTLEILQRNQDNMQKRMDSHSKKQDEILDAISKLKLEVIKQLDATAQEQAVIATELKHITNALSKE